MSTAGPSERELVPLFREVAATRARCVWLDGAGGRDRSGTRSLLAWCDEDDPSLTYDAARREVVRHAGGRAEVVGDDVFAVLAEELARDPGGTPGRWFGYLGYAARPDLPAATGSGLPDAVWIRPRHVRAVRHVLPPRSSRLSHEVSCGEREFHRPTGETHPAPSYLRAFDRVQEHLHAGNTYEVNLTYRSSHPATGGSRDPVATYLRLRALNPAPYAGFLQHDVPGYRGWLLSSSPERYARVDRTGGAGGAGGARSIETRPIKGTTPRGATPAEDEELRDRLRTDPKLRSENLMVLDLLRNDVAMVSEPGTVEVPALMEVESYPSVHQLVSTVRGRLREDVTTIAALRALFPAGSMTGAPKLRTMQVIEEVEDSPRGVYAGAFGWVDADGTADLGVVIRSLTTAGDGTWTLGTGGGVTVRSDPAEEHAETRWKAERLLRALEG